MVGAPAINTRGLTPMDDHAAQSLRATTFLVAGCWIVTFISLQQQPRAPSKPSLAVRAASVTWFRISRM